MYLLRAKHSLKSGLPVVVSVVSNLKISIRRFVRERLWESVIDRAYSRITVSLQQSWVRTFLCDVRWAVYSSLVGSRDETAEAEPAPCTISVLVIPMLVNSVWSVCGMWYFVTIDSRWERWCRYAIIEHHTMNHNIRRHLPKTIDTPQQDIQMHKWM